MPINATKEHLAKYSVSPREALRLERALCALVDFEGPVKQALGERGSDWDLHNVCDAIRRIIDGEE